jgi:tetratricopeptide (TPR) repeat protein
LPADNGPFANLIARQIAQAGKAGQAGDLRGEFESWKVVAALRPEAAEPRKRVADLAVQLEREAEHHFQQGLKSFQAGAFEPARREFILTLINNPDHAEALDYLKNRIEPVFISYQSAAGETFESIAKKIYADSSKAIIIARLNDLDQKVPLVPGTTLLIPSSLLVLARAGEAYVAEPPDTGKEVVGPPVIPLEEKKMDTAKQNLTQAQELFLAHLYPECIAIAERLTGHPSLGKKARDLVSASWFERGNRYLKEDRLQEASDSYKKSDLAVRDEKGALVAVAVRRREKAEEYYNEGVKLFINQKLEQAVAVWQKTLVLNPVHHKAPKDIDKALALLEKLKKLK